MRPWEVLTKAQAILAEGWCQGNMHNLSETKHCIIGAMKRAGVDCCNDSWNYIMKEMPREFNYDTIKYNDAPGRTQAEVLALFDRAIARAP